MPIVISNQPKELRSLAQQAGEGLRVEREDALRTSALSRDLAVQQAELQQQQSDRADAALQQQQIQQAFANQFAIKNFEAERRDRLFAEQRLIINEQTRVREAKEEQARAATALKAQQKRENLIAEQKRKDAIAAAKAAQDAQTGRTILQQEGANTRQKTQIGIDLVKSIFTKAAKTAEASYKLALSEKKAKQQEELATETALRWRKEGSVSDDTLADVQAVIRHGGSVEDIIKLKKDANQIELAGRNPFVRNQSHKRDVLDFNLESARLEHKETINTIAKLEGMLDEDGGGTIKDAATAFAGQGGQLEELENMFDQNGGASGVERKALIEAMKKKKEELGVRIRDLMDRRWLLHDSLERRPPNSEERGKLIEIATAPIRKRVEQEVSDSIVLHNAKNPDKKFTEREALLAVDKLLRSATNQREINDNAAMLARDSGYTGL